MTTTTASPINRLLSLIPKRAESRQARELSETFVDAGIALALESVDHQVLFGRRGTGKTHALRYVETSVGTRGDIAIYLDLRTIGSPQGVFADGDELPAVDRAASLLVDLLGAFHDALLEAALNDDRLLVDRHFVDRLDRLAESITRIRVDGEVEIAREDERADRASDRADLAAGLGRTPALQFGISHRRDGEARQLTKEVRRGSERIGLHFGEVAAALRELAGSLTSAARVWLLLDEWSSVPHPVQPHLAEFLVRCILPLQPFTVKIAAIEQQSAFQRHNIDRPHDRH